MSTATLTKLTGDKFPLGQTVMTQGVKAAMFNHGLNPVTFLQRHASGDWGDCCPSDARANERALKDGDRIFSVYKVHDELTIWVITEHDRSSTCVLLPSEY